MDGGHTATRAPHVRSASAKLQAVRGMNDVLPDEATVWQRFEATVRDVFRAVRLPQPARAAGRGHRRCSCAASAS